MIGRRVYAWSGSPLLEPGEYARHEQTRDWFGCTPNGHLAGLASHNVIEHDDGSITVAPSILIAGIASSDAGIRVTDGSTRRELWHGYLERGVWRSC